MEAESAKTLGDAIRRAWFSGDVLDCSADSESIAITTGIASSIEIRLTSTTAPLVWRRDPHHIARDHSDTCIIWFVLTGAMKITGPHGTHVIRAGHLCIMNAHVPFIVDGSHTPENPLATLTVSAPDHLMRRHIAMEPHIGIAYSSGGDDGVAAEKLFRILLDHGEGLERAIANRLADSAVHCVCRAILARDDARPAATNTGRKIDEILSFINANLADPDLSGDIISAHCGISRRHLHHLLRAGETSLGDLIWKQRLYTVASWLGDTAMTEVPIADLAYAAGYKNYEHFCRAFRKAFGMPPRHYRTLRQTPVQGGRDIANDPGA